MYERSLQSEITNFEDLLKAHDKLQKLGERGFKGGNPLAHNLCEILAMISAFRIRRCANVINEMEVADFQGDSDDCDPGENLPDYDSVRTAAQDLLEAINPQNHAKILRALKEMGVFTLCPTLRSQIGRIEVVAGRVAGRARLIPLVELSLFAAEIEQYEDAKRYVLLAHSFGPNSYELYNLCIVEGLVALDAGRTREAIQFLDRSIDACFADEYASLKCGVRPPNFSLAQKLLRGGERIDVLRHLIDCQEVWQLLRPQIGEWIKAVETGKIPEFQASETLDAMTRLSSRLRMQWISACSLGEMTEMPRSFLPKSRAEVLAGRERLRAEYKRLRDEDLEREHDTGEI